MITEAISMFNELDLLEAHLEESQTWADRIVIIESPHTFTSIEKPMYFADNRERFARFNVDYLVTPKEVFIEIPEKFPEEETRKWFQARRDNRNNNRQHHWKELCRDADYVYLNDVDEFVSRDHGPYLLDLLKDNHWHYMGITTRKFNFFVNSRGSKQAQYRIARSDMATFIPEKGTPRMNTREIGWHFTSCLSPKELHNKYLGIYLHLGMTRDEIPSVEEIERRLENNIEPAMKTVLRQAEIMPKDDLSWAPMFMRQNLDLFPWIDIEFEAANPGWRRATTEGWWNLDE